MAFGPGLIVGIFGNEPATLLPFRFRAVLIPIT